MQLDILLSHEAINTKNNILNWFFFGMLKLKRVRHCSLTGSAEKTKCGEKMEPKLTLNYTSEMQTIPERAQHTYTLIHFV